MPTEGEAAAVNIAARMELIPAAVEQYQRTVLKAAAEGHVSARQQIIEVAKQSRTS